MHDKRNARNRTCCSDNRRIKVKIQVNKVYLARPNQTRQSEDNKHPPQHPRGSWFNPQAKPVYGELRLRDRIRETSRSWNKKVGAPKRPNSPYNFKERSLSSVQI